MTSFHIYKAHGIVLKRRNVGEADRMITLFTKEQGKIRVIAKGIRRIHSRRGPHLEVFRLVSAAIHKGKIMDGITEVQSRVLLSIDRTSAQKMSFGYYMCELVDRLLPERQEHADVFRLMQVTFMSLDANNEVKMWERDIFSFALELLWILGYLPRTTTLREEHIQQYIEGIIERKLRTPKLLHQLGLRALS